MHLTRDVGTEASSLLKLWIWQVIFGNIYTCRIVNGKWKFW